MNMQVKNPFLILVTSGIFLQIFCYFRYNIVFWSSYSSFNWIINFSFYFWFFFESIIIFSNIISSSFFLLSSFFYIFFFFFYLHFYFFSFFLFLFLGHHFYFLFLYLFLSKDNTNITNIFIRSKTKWISSFDI